MLKKLIVTLLIAASFTGVGLESVSASTVVQKVVDPGGIGH